MQQINWLLVLGVWLLFYFPIKFIGRKLFSRISIDMSSEMATLLAAVIAVFSNRRFVVEHPVAGIFIALCLFGLIRFFVKRNTDKNDHINWSPYEAIGITATIYLVAQFIGAGLAYIYPALRGWSEAQASRWLQESAVGQFTLILCIEAFTVGMLIIFLRRRKAGIATIGVKGRPGLKELKLIAGGYIVYFLLFLAASALTRALIPSIDFDQSQQIGFKDAAGISLIPVFFSLVLLPPIAEELITRGFLYSGLKKGMPKFWAVLLTSGIFAAAHLQPGSGEPLLWVAAIDTFILSIVLIQLRERSGGKLWAPIGLHMVKNLIAFTALFVLHVAK